MSPLPPKRLEFLEVVEHHGHTGTAEVEDVLYLSARGVVSDLETVFVVSRGCAPA